MQQTHIRRRGFLRGIGLAVLASGCTTADRPGTPRAGSSAPDSPPAPPATPPSPSPPPSPKPPPVLEHGPGTFTVAPGGTKRIGTAGTLMRYRVEVEDGIQVPPAEFAAAVDAILADPRGWTAVDDWSFQRVGKGDADMLVRLATPDTVDKICADFWLDTAGEYSCRGGDYVMINLRRWLLAVPHFDDDLETYRDYLINHEVGHRLGHGHVGCPTPDGPAPVMTPQTISLHGCRPNGWPYPDGELLTGPPIA